MRSILDSQSQQTAKRRILYAIASAHQRIIILNLGSHRQKHRASFTGAFLPQHERGIAARPAASNSGSSTAIIVSRIKLDSHKLKMRTQLRQQNGALTTGRVSSQRSILCSLLTPLNTNGCFRVCHLSEKTYLSLKHYKRFIVALQPINRSG